MVFSVDDMAYGLLGGAMIGCAAAALLLLNGRIAGVSGIAAAVVTPSLTKDLVEKLSFLLGLVLAPAAWAYWVADPGVVVTDAPAMLVAGGLLVGVGTRMGSGCTSGHGVCGVTRASPRSIAATAVFMAVGVAAATLLEPLFAAATS